MDLVFACSLDFFVQIFLADVIQHVTQLWHQLTLELLKLVTLDVL